MNGTECVSQIKCMCFVLYSHLRIISIIYDLQTSKRHRKKERKETNPIHSYTVAKVVFNEYYLYRSNVIHIYTL